MLVTFLDKVVKSCKDYATDHNILPIALTVVLIIILYISYESYVLFSNRIENIKAFITEQNTTIECSLKETIQYRNRVLDRMAVLEQDIREEINLNSLSLNAYRDITNDLLLINSKIELKLETLERDFYRVYWEYIEPEAKIEEKK